MAVSDKDEIEWQRERAETWKQITMDYKWLVAQYARLLRELAGSKIVAGIDSGNDLTSIYMSEFGEIRLRPTTERMFERLMTNGRRPAPGTREAKQWGDLERWIETAARIWQAAGEDLKEI